MRKLKLQVQMTVDGYVAGLNGEMDWMNATRDDALEAHINALTDSSDTILLGRKMTDGFVNYWTDVATNQPESREFAFAKKMVDTPKVVFSKTLDYVYELAGDTLTIWGGQKGSPAYYKGKFSQDGNTVAGEWTYPGGGYKSTMTRIG